jgi:iron complex outermembrane receptor protein
MKHLLHGVALAVLATACAQAEAQEAPAAEAPTPAADRPVQLALADEVPAVRDDQGLGDIVVTATRRETNLQRTPVAVSVVDEQVLEDRHIQSLHDFADGAVPSLRITTFEARQSALTVGIRGIVPLDANQPAREQGVGIYVDGVYLGRQHGLNAALFDVARIEVLKGPQGTLFGRNTEGGALNIVSARPTGAFGGRISAGVGNYGSYTGEIHLNLPEFYNLRFKLDGVIQHQDATTENPLQGATGWSYYDRQGLRAQVEWRPSDNLTVDFSYDYGHDSNSPYYSQLLNYNPNGCVAGAQAAAPACRLPGTAYTTLTGAVRPVLPGVVVNGATRMEVADIGVPQQPSVDRTHGYIFHVNYRPSADIELRAITAWRGVTATQWDNAGGAHRVPLPAPGCTGAACNFSRYSLANLSQDQFSQEFQAVGTIGPVDYVGGLYYFTEHVSDDAATPNSNAITGYTTAGQTAGFQYVILDPCIGSAGFGSQEGCRSIDRASEVESRSYAIYGQATWHATEALRLTVGGRYTRDHKQGVLHFSRNVNYDVNTAAATAAGYQPLDETWTRFNPMVTVAYDVTPDIHPYATFSTGYRAGGASSRTSNYQAFAPEDVRSYELGVKTDLFDRRVRLNLAAFLMDRDDSQVDISSIQTTASGSFNNLVTINAPGTTHIRGFEADLAVNPVEGLTLTAAYAYTYTRIPPVPITYSATTGGVTTSTTVLQNFYIVFTPPHAASGSIDYEFPIGNAEMRFHLDANYSSATQTFDQFATKNDSSLLFNGRIALADIPMGSGGQLLTLSVWGRNLFDEHHVYRRDPSNSLPAAPTTSVTAGNIAGVLGDYGNFNAPRTFGIEATVHF